MNYLKAALIRALLQVSARLPLSAARALGRGLAQLYWPLGGSSRRVTEINIAVAFPELKPADRAQLARNSFRATGELVTEMGHVWLRPWPYTRELILAVTGAELVCEAQAAGRGVIVLAPHLGNWEVAGLHLATLGSTVALYEPPHLDSLGPMLAQARQRSGATLVPTDSRGLATLLRSVRNGKISGILPDQVPPDVSAGMNVPFMGQACFTGSLASNMIRRTGALAVFSFAQRVPGGFAVHYLAADPAIYDADTAVSLAALNRGVERCLRSCPEQYQWEYKRYKVRPKDGPGIYNRPK